MELLNQRKEDLFKEKEARGRQWSDQRGKLSQLYQQLLDEIKREKSNALQYEFTNPHVQELTRTVAQLKCDKESAYKRLKYMEAKLLNTQESVAHARQVLDNHVL